MKINLDTPEGIAEWKAAAINCASSLDEFMYLMAGTENMLAIIKELYYLPPIPEGHPLNNDIVKDVMETIRRIKHTKIWAKRKKSYTPLPLLPNMNGDDNNLRDKMIDYSDTMGGLAKSSELFFYHLFHSDRHQGSLGEKRKYNISYKRKPAFNWFFMQEMAL